MTGPEVITLHQAYKCGTCRRRIPAGAEAVQLDDLHCVPCVNRALHGTWHGRLRARLHRLLR